ncbi:bifunctional folylpolyglutamate synthase/dihydrofolate synthase [Leptospira gomenensis]|uniref:Bifunctional folylpolyglutamate synthase/dihydrofolate synthase n=1 Tax=Leptospira gomenensis TaxID=2484974 RepID=A0A5F1Z2T7_9LEPT|nr:cyanophycin synthetase [Leptospira gomenensis]TGK32431.1 bifunctional folylpolyglutamate synthase/dihydrofolate synthase [Leptospira gomenensis]TGK34672.1 bifunctional folylpolyglutamate synthase/dihydrofolate synthase [Leptospira gomenensis]TGK51031.1 bifunctional folylpolyglutamate synthase/dihydrofolate synthase [Leptospira gomenensis]TGK68328.1 bifunctional folylpolyglutamate synthase/dihydrofolate synthase [Leptospira gomenensis]
MNPSFFEFVSTLSNLEKTRNFDVFAGYSLSPYSNILNKYGWNSRSSSTLCRIGVVGTNAKGSITHYLGEYFRLTGFKTGLYTSPHLLSPTERIRIGSETEPFREIQETELDELLNESLHVGAEADLKTMSFFEFFTSAAFRFFEKEKIGIQIYEAGLGGRLDATKLAEPDVVILGSIGLDHAEILGRTKAEILNEKLGILSENTKVLYCLEQKEPELNEIVRTVAAKRKIEYNILPEKPANADYLTKNRNFSFRVYKNILNFEWMRRSSKESSAKNPSSPKPSAETAILRVSESDPRVVAPPGRLNVVRNSPLLVFDPAHNPDAFRETLRSLKILYPSLRFRVYVGLLKDKDGETILKILRSTLNDGDLGISGFRFLDEEGFSVPNSCSFEEIENGSEFRRLLSQKEKESDPILILGSFRLFAIVRDFL